MIEMSLSKVYIEGTIMSKSVNMSKYCLKNLMNMTVWFTDIMCK